MTRAAIESGLARDFQRLYKMGSSDAAVDGCVTLGALGPVEQAIARGATLARACRTLLDMTVERATEEDQRYIRAGAAITGIKPRSTIGGVKNAAGRDIRKTNAGTEDGEIGPRAAYDKRERHYYPAYATAVLNFVDEMLRNEEQLTIYLSRCGIAEAAATGARLGDSGPGRQPPAQEQPLTPEYAASRSARPEPAGRRLTRRIATYAALAVAVGAVGVIALTVLRGEEGQGQCRLKNSWACAKCADVGNNQPGNPDPLWGNLFREAYQRAGGEAELGCPRKDDPSGYIHPWANGLSQDLQGGKAGKARIMTLGDPRPVLVVAGTYYEDYTTPYGDNAAQTMGYPVSDPIPCGSTMKVVLLDGAEKTKYFAREQTPGAMVTNPRTSRLIWVPRDIWERYVRLDGPLGRLGGPVSNLEQTPGGAVQYFENGYIKIVDGTAKTDLEDQGRREPAPTSNIANCLPS
jgi:hypothetical protein